MHSGWTRSCWMGDAEAVCRANIFLRTAERVLLKVGSFHAVTFEELFDKTRELPWEDYVSDVLRMFLA